MVRGCCHGGWFVMNGLFDAAFLRFSRARRAFWADLAASASLNFGGGKGGCSIELERFRLAIPFGTVKESTALTLGDGRLS